MLQTHKVPIILITNNIDNELTVNTKIHLKSAWRISCMDDNYIAIKNRLNVL